MGTEKGLRRMPLGTGAMVVAKMLPEEANRLRSISSKESPWRAGRAVPDGPATEVEGAGGVADS